MNPMEPKYPTTPRRAAARRVVQGLMTLAATCSVLGLGACVPAC